MEDDWLQFELFQKAGNSVLKCIIVAVDYKYLSDILRFGQLHVGIFA